MTDKTLEDELRETLDSIKPIEETVEEPTEELEGTTEEVIEEVEETEIEEPESALEPEKVVIEEPAPTAWSGAVKDKWKELPPEVRNEIKKREDDIHRMMTAKDGDLNLGRTIKEIATPYEAIIRSEGGTVEGAFKDLLNTAYVLRTGTPQQKAQLIMQTAQQYGVDLGAYNSQNQNPLSAIQQQIQELRQQADPNLIKSQLQEEMERDRIEGEIQAFAANPANVHFEAVKSTMGSLITSGRAKDLQEAYDMAIWSDPSIRTDLLKAQQAKEVEKKKTEMNAKKKASASVAGSYGTASPNTNAPQKSLEDEIRDQISASSGKI